MGLFNERLPESLDAKLVIACHDDLVLECPIEQAKEVARFLEEAMVDGMDGVLNAPDAEGPRVPAEVEVESGRSWAG